MTWERPTEEDMMRCAGCGSVECDSECEAYRRLEQQAYIDESMGVYLPAYCATIDRKICTRCGRDWEDDSPLCDACNALVSPLASNELKG